MPKLTLVATPIGNLGDLSPRTAEALKAADFWIVEDTRVSGKLQSVLGVSKTMRVFNEHSSEYAVKQLIEEISKGQTACLLTDAGSPSISDPGTILADKCYDSKIEVDAIPGPSAVTTAIALSGFFGQRFAFLGFLGRKSGAIREELLIFKESPLTLVLFESPHRLNNLMQVAFEALGPRRFAVCREISKLHQQVLRGNLPMISSDSELPRKGEITVVIEGIRRKMDQVRYDCEIGLDED